MRTVQLWCESCCAYSLSMRQPKPKSVRKSQKGVKKPRKKQLPKNVRVLPGQGTIKGKEGERAGAGAAATGSRGRHAATLVPLAVRCKLAPLSDEGLHRAPCAPLPVGGAGLRAYKGDAWSNHKDRCKVKNVPGLTRTE